jgi:hypothetical protein
MKSKLVPYHLFPTLIMHREEKIIMKTSLPARNIISILDSDALGHVIDLVDTDEARRKFELRRPISGEVLYAGRRQFTMLFRREMTMNCAFLVLSLM